MKKKIDMAISTPEQLRDRRFQLRATASEEALIKTAASREGVNVTDFIIRSAYEKAEKALADQTRFAIDDRQWKALWLLSTGRLKDKARLSSPVY